MQPPSARLVCRARNSFSPSTALWQHFVAPNQHLLYHGRHSSSVPATTQVAATNHTEHHASPEPTISGQPRVEPRRKQGSKFTIRKVNSVHSSFVRSKRTASIQKNIQDKVHASKESLAAIGQLLLDTGDSYEKHNDYEGVVVKPIVSEITVKPRYFPWCIPVEERPPAPTDRLNREIALFHEYMRPDPFESIARKHLIEQVRTHVRETHPHCVLEVFGSERTGVAFAMSDIDLRLVHKSDLSDPSSDVTTSQKPPDQANRKSITAELHNIHQHFRKKPEYEDPLFLYARYPLIAIRDRNSGLDVQIVLANDTSVSRRYMAKYMAEYPYLGQVYSVVKAIFDVRGLSNVFMGGFGSYSLFMMLVASIKHSPSDRNDAAGALLSFLRFWRHFDTTAHGISIEPIELYDKTASEDIMNPKAKGRIRTGKNRPLPPFMLSLRDPADETNDLGRKGIAIKHVQATMADMCGKLDGALRHNTLQTMLTPLVDPVYMLNKQGRYKLRNYGKRLSTGLQLSLASKAKAIREAEAASTATSEAEDMWEGLPGMESDAKVV